MVTLFYITAKSTLQWINALLIKSDLLGLLCSDHLLKGNGMISPSDETNLHCFTEGPQECKTGFQVKVVSYDNHLYKIVRIQSTLHVVSAFRKIWGLCTVCGGVFFFPTLKRSCLVQKHEAVQVFPGVCPIIFTFFLNKRNLYWPWSGIYFFK